MRLRSPFTLYSRETSKGAVWYASWYDADGRRRIRSTGIAARGASNRKRAEVKAVQLVGRPGARSPTLAEYARDFYRWEASTWIARQHAKGRGFNRQWAQSQQAMLDNYVLPRFGALRMDALTRPMVESWLVTLPLSNQTRNQMLYGLRTVLREAESEGITARNPLEHVEPMGKGGRKRDVFSLEELRLRSLRRARG